MLAFEVGDILLDIPAVKTPLRVSVSLFWKISDLFLRA